MSPLRTLFGVVCATSAAGGCQAEPERQVWRGEHVEVVSEEGVTLCGGTSAFFDRFVESVGGYWTSGRWQAPSERLVLELRSGSTGTFSGQAVSPTVAWAGTQSLLLHELVHLITWGEDGLSANALSEGVAEGIGATEIFDIWLDFFQAEHPSEFAFLPREQFDDGPPGQHYAASAQMVAALERRYGIEAVRRAYQLAPREGPSEAIEAAYVEAFGDTLYDTFDEIAEERPCGFRQWQCDPGVVPVVQLPYAVTEAQTLSCGSEELVGAEFSGEGRWYPESVFLLDLEEETAFTVELGNAFLYGFACRDACVGPEVAPRDLYFPYEAGTRNTLPAGRYFFRTRPADRTRPFSLSFLPA